MGRRKRQTFLEETKPVVSAGAPEIIQWETAIYARLSVENSKKDDGGASIEEQVAICREYIDEHPYLHLAGTFIDNGWTGTNMKRPQFQKMIEEIKEGRIKALVIKDFSRFSRDYIEAGNLLENVFPFFGVRFISVSDNYDSFETDGSAESLLIPLKNLINSFYSRDMSRKVSTAVHTKQLAAEHIPSAIPYGYRKSTTQAYRFEPDPETRDVVTRIFKMRLDGMEFSAIARKLNEEGIPSPGHLRWLRGVSKDPKYEHAKWNCPCVKQICMNPTYTGDLVFGRMPTALYLGQPDYHYEYDESKWRILKDMHEPLIDRETFEILKERRIKRNKEWNDKLEATKEFRENNQPLFHKMIFCGDCGRGMGYHRSIKPGSKNGSYHCQNYFLNECKHGFHTIAQTKIVAVVQHVISDQLLFVADFDALTARLNRGEETGRQTELRNEVQSLSVQMKSRQVKRERLYEDYSDGILTAEEYTMMKLRFDEEYQQLNRQLNALLVQQAKLNKTLSSENKWLESMRSVIDGGELTRELVVAMVEKVLVYEDADHQKRIEVVLKYQEEFETLRSAWEELKGEGQE